MSSLEKLERIKKNCEKCSGSGLVPRRTEEGLYLDDCDCTKAIEEKIKLVEANIQEQYWDFSIEDINKDFKEENCKQLDLVNKYIDELGKNIEEGNGIWFFSSPGLGKSTVISSILKKAIDKGYNSYYMRTSHMVSLKFDALRNRESSRLINYIIDHVDILALEELEKVYLVNDDSMANQLFYEFLSDMYDTRKALLISTNQPRIDVSKKLPTFIQDRLRHLDEVIFTGDGSKRKNFYDK